MKANLQSKPRRILAMGGDGKSAGLVINERSAAAMKPMLEWYEHHDLKGNPLILGPFSGVSRKL